MYEIVIGTYFIYRYALYQVTVKSTDQVKLVNNVGTKLGLDIWAHAIPGRPGTVLVEPEKKELFENALKSIGVEYKVETENVQEWV